MSQEKCNCSRCVEIRYLMTCLEQANAQKNMFGFGGNVCNNKVAPKPVKIEFVESGEVVPSDVIAWNLRMQAKQYDKLIAPPKLKHKLPEHYSDFAKKYQFRDSGYEAVVNAIVELQSLVEKLMSNGARQEKNK